MSTAARLFFPRGLDPILNGGPRNKNAVVAPREVPTGHAIGHVVLNDQSHGRLLYPVGILALERGEVGLIGREESDDRPNSDVWSSKYAGRSVGRSRGRRDHERCGRLHPGLTHHNSESGLAGKPYLLIKLRLLDHTFATFRYFIDEYSVSQLVLII